METRRVNKVGAIRYGNEPIFISTALTGWSVGLEPCAQGTYNVWASAVGPVGPDERQLQANQPRGRSSKGGGMSSPRPPRGAPKTGPRPYAPGREGRSQTPRPGAALPLFGTAVEPPSGDNDNDNTVNP